MESGQRAGKKSRINGGRKLKKAYRNERTEKEGGSVSRITTEQVLSAWGFLWWGGGKKKSRGASIISRKVSNRHTIENQARDKDKMYWDLIQNRSVQLTGHREAYAVNQGRSSGRERLEIPGRSKRTLTRK